MEILDKAKKSFKFTWRIKNFSFCWKKSQECIFSPTFQVLREDTFTWNLRLYPNGEGNYIFCFLERSKNNSSSYSIGYELAFLASDNSTLNFLEVPEAASEDEFLDSPLLVHRDVVLGQERAAFLPHDCLTIQCKIWPLGDWTLDKEQCFAETEIEVQKYSSIWTIERFSNLKLDEKVSHTSNDASINKSLSFSLCKSEFIICLGLYPVDSVPVKIYKCLVFLLNSEGKWVKCGTHEYQLNWKETKMPSVCMLNFTPKYLIRNKHRYLPNDALTLQFEIEFSCGKETAKCLELHSLLNSSDVAQILEPNSQPNSSDAAQTIATHNFPLYAEQCADLSLPWKDDLLLMYNKGLFCDTNLKTFSKSFPVHSLILRIQSSVFNDMLDSDDSGGLCIEKLDENTVQKLIFYLYTGTLDDLNVESAKHLYFASNKYEITSLKHLCSSFLTEHLEPSNCCDILYMAGIHKDHSLISVVQCFISKHGKDIVLSDSWKNLEQKDFLLAYKTLCKLYLEI